MDIEKKIAEELGLKLSDVENVVKLLDEGNTVPFIARYRKEQTGSMLDMTIRELSERLEYLRNLEAKKEETVRLIEEQGKLTEALREEIMAAETLQRVDDLYRPYRPNRRTRATIAKEKGLEPLSLAMNLESPDGESFLQLADTFINEEKEVHTREEALQGAMDIIAESISDDADVRGEIKHLIRQHGFIRTDAVDAEQKSVYEMYYEFKEALKSVANHRVLALNRGEKEKFLKVSIFIDKVDPVEKLVSEFVVKKNSVPGGYKALAIEDGYKRLLFPSLEREIRNDLTEVAEEEAIKVFALNLKPLLMQPPIRNMNVLAIDPGFRTGCKVAVIDDTGKLLDYATIYPTEPRNDIAGAKKKLKGFIEKYKVELISIGNGTASRETEAMVAELIQELNIPLSYIIASEAGASIYSASEVGIKEFPDLDVSIRGAVSIGRRIQDPLPELVKIEPKHIGVGQYQHDLNQTKLDDALTGVVEDCVNAVGVDLNTASPSLLKYIAGITKRTADSIVSHREENGKFSNRKELKKVKGIGAKTYEQCIGFLRIPNGEEPLDNTGVHPESYEVAHKLLEKGYKSKDVKTLSEELGVGIPTLSDIIKELEKPGRDPRDELPKPILKSDVLKIEDLKEGMILKGTVRNVVDFGAFVDIGVKEDGLVHISRLSDKFVKHPKEVVRVGDIVEVKITEIDTERNRIGLSMKGLKSK